MEWKPYPFQERILERSEFEVLAGGARGPGKTEAGIIWLLEYYQEPLAKSLVIRKNFDDLVEWIERAMVIYRVLGATYTQNPATIRFPAGYYIRLGHLKDDQAYTKYQGHEYHRMLIEELTQIPDERRYLQLTASCRTSIPHLRPQILGTTNPGGVGHGWVKKRFVDPAPWGTPFQDQTHGLWRIFVPGKIEDNPSLLAADPHYIKSLDALKETDIELYKAWRLGDWDTFAGQFFREFDRAKHVVKARTPSAKLDKRAGIDWGRTAPFVFLASAVVEVKLESGVTFNRCFVYQEIDGTEKTPKEWAEVIKSRVKIEEFTEIRADPAIFTKGQDRSVSIAQQFKDEGIWVLPASNDRIGGWTVIHDWLSIAPDGAPYLLIGDNCTNLVNTLPSLVHDERKVEDLTSDGPDHWADACFIGGTMIETDKGEVDIIDIKVGDLVLTRDGYKRVEVAGCTNKREVYEINLSNGQSLTGTADHPIWTNGWKPLSDLRYGDKMFTCKEMLSNTAAETSIVIPNQPIFTLEDTTLIANEASYIVEFTKITMVKFQKVFISTTRTGIRLIMNLQTSKQNLLKIMLRITGIIKSLLAENVTIAPIVTKLKSLLRLDQDFVPITVKVHGAVRAARITLKSLVSIATKYLLKAAIQEKSVVQDDVPYVIGIEPKGIALTYNLQVEGKPEYFANGVLVHNCRYMLKHIKWIDAKVGAIDYTHPVTRLKRTATISDTGRQIPVDFSRFR